MLSSCLLRRGRIRTGRDAARRVLSDHIMVMTGELRTRRVQIPPSVFLPASLGTEASEDVLPCRNLDLCYLHSSGVVDTRLSMFNYSNFNSMLGRCIGRVHDNGLLEEESYCFLVVSFRVEVERSRHPVRSSAGTGVPGSYPQWDREVDPSAPDAGGHTPDSGGYRIIQTHLMC